MSPWVTSCGDVKRRTDVFLCHVGSVRCGVGAPTLVDRSKSDGRMNKGGDRRGVGGRSPDEILTCESLVPAGSGQGRATLS